MKFSRHRILPRRMVLIGLAVLMGVPWILLPDQTKAAEVAIDSSLHTTNQRYRNSQPNLVYTTDQVGYIFYGEANSDCVYSKTTDGGATWGTPVQVDSSGGCIGMSIWYDRWTPGDTTGTSIYTISFAQTELRYNRLDTSTDTLEMAHASAVEITSAPGPAKTNSYDNSMNRATITKATDGELYVGSHDGAGVGDTSFIISCSTTCGTASNWADVGTVPIINDDKNFLHLMPLAAGNILAIEYADATQDWQSKVWNGTTWDASWTTFETNAPDNTTYVAKGSATINRITGDIYFTYTAQNATLGTDDDVRTALYSGGSWTLMTDVLTDSCTGIPGCNNRGVLSAKISVNENNGDVYVVYAARTTPGTATTGNVYWKKSTDGMTTWGSEQGPMNGSSHNTFGPYMDLMSSDRLFVAWTNVATDTLLGDTMADLVPPTFEQSAFRFVANADSTTSGASLAALNTAVVVPSGTPFRLRLLIHVGGDGVQANHTDFALQYAPSSGTCDTAFSGETYANIGGNIAFFNNPTPVDGATAVSTASDPTHGGGVPHTNVLQKYEEANNFNIRTKIATGQDGLWDFSLIDTTHSAGTSYCFRVLKADASQLTTYTVIPEYQQPSLDSIMRHGNSFINETEQSASW